MISTHEVQSVVKNVLLQAILGAPASAPTLREEYRFFADINECGSGLHDCDQVCHNIPGSYRCSCAEGFTLVSDNATCEGKKE